MAMRKWWGSVQLARHARRLDREKIGTAAHPDCARADWLR
jgi:hypothetical protein